VTARARTHDVTEIDTATGATRVSGRGPTTHRTARKTVCTTKAKVIMIRASNLAPVSHPAVVAGTVRGVIKGSVTPGLCRLPNRGQTVIASKRQPAKPPDSGAR